MRAHTQNSVVVYVSHEEKEDIRNEAKKLGFSMSNYLLNLHLINIKKKNEANDAG